MSPVVLGRLLLLLQVLGENKHDVHIPYHLMLNPIVANVNKQTKTTTLRDSWVGVFSLESQAIPTVNGGNPAPSGMYKTLEIMGDLPYQLVRRISSINSRT